MNRMEQLRKRCLDIANALIVENGLTVSSITSLKDINSEVIIYLVETITNENIPDLIECKSKEDEAQNLQTVIDFLSLDVLGISLSHLTGEDIVSGKTTSLFYLLEVLEGVSEHLSRNGFTPRGNILKRKTCKRKNRPHSKIFQFSSVKNAPIESTIKVKAKNSKKCDDSPDRNLLKEQAQFSKPHSPIGLQGRGVIQKRKTRKLLKKQPSKKLNSSMDVEDLFANNLKRKLQVIIKSETSVSPRANRMKGLQMQSIKKPVRKSPIAACKKSFLLPHTLRRRGASKVSTKKTKLKSPIKKVPPSQGGVDELLEAFPDIQLPRPLLDHLHGKYDKHMVAMHSKLTECLDKKPKTQVQAEEAMNKQSSLSKILKRDIEKQKNLADVRHARHLESRVKFGLRDARLRSAKMKHYCEEFRKEMTSRTNKRNYTKERIFEKAFEDAVHAQREQVDQLCRDAREAESKDARQHALYLEALENLYQSQYSMLRETLRSEQSDAEIRATTDREAMRSLERTFRDELTKEIRFMQDVIVDCLAEDTHFTEQDAQNYKSRLDRKRAR